MVDGLNSSTVLFHFSKPTQSGNSRAAEGASRADRWPEPGKSPDARFLPRRRMLVALAKHVHDDVGVQQERLHLLQNCFSKRASDSWRSFLTHAAAPALSSGWSLSFHAPVAWRSASF